MSDASSADTVFIAQRWADLPPESLAIIAQVQGTPVRETCGACGATVILSPLSAAHITQLTASGQTVVIRCLPCVPPEDLKGADVQIVPGAEREIARTLAAEQLRRQRRN